MYYRNSITPQQSMQARTEDWGARWNRATVSSHILLQEMQSQRQEARDWSAESVLHTLSSMKANRARGVDGWTPGEMLRLPKRAIAGLANVMQAVEESLALSHPDLRQRRGLAGQAEWSWRKACHAHWVPLRNLHGRSPKGSAPLG